MAQRAAKEPLRRFVEAAVARVRESGETVGAFRGIAYFDTAKDANFTSLDAFGAAKEAVANLPVLDERYGLAELDRLALQYVYETLARIKEPSVDDDDFNAVWNAFVAELEEPEWVNRGFANARNVKSVEPWLI